MTFGTIELIQTVTVGAGGQPAIEFTNIPSTYDDLRIVMSARSTGTNANAQGFCYFSFNGSTSDFSSRRLIQDGTSMSLDTGGRFAAFIPNNSATANTFGTMVFYLANYRSTNNKAYSVDQGMENNSTTAYLQGMQAGLWSNSAAITSITIGSVIDSNGVSASFAQHSTATLYGITRIPSGAKATGGVITDDATHWYHTFTSSGTFTPSQNLSCDYLVIAGGGGAGIPNTGGGPTGGGGAGGLLNGSTSLIVQTYSITVGAGGSTNANGSNSVFSTFTSIGGGRGGDGDAGASGGSGGGGGTPGSSTSWSGTLAGGSGTLGQGNNGGSGSGIQGTGGWAGGGGGAGGAGVNANGSVRGDGGAGLSYSSWATATGTGVNGFYAGGGGGGRNNSGPSAVGGSGGGGSGSLAGFTNATAGVANTGGGGGGAGGSGNTSQQPGGSGVVIVRYAK